MSAQQMPEPKYRLGETVWHGSCFPTTRRLECPDCKGTGKWPVTTPGGRALEMKCPRCSYGSRQTLTVQDFTAKTTLLTVGQIRIEWPKTHFDRDENPIQYMMVETGVGGGSLYNEDSIFATEEEAEGYALGQVLKARGRQSEETKKREAAALEWGTYDIINAEVAEAQEKMRKAQRALGDLQNSIGELFEDDNSAVTARDLREQLRELIPADCLPASARQP